MSPACVTLRAALAGACLLALLGCADAPPAPPMLPTRSEPAPLPPALAPTSDPVLDFERSQLQRASAAERQGRLAEAAWAWEALSVLRPQQREYAAGLQQIRVRILNAVTEGMARATEERRRGDLDRAARAFLQVLALAPDHQPAADGLRAIERERNQRNFVGRFSRLTVPRSSAAEAEQRPEIAPANGAASSTDRNIVEHASMLAGQGEIDAAIALVKRPAEERGADPALRRLLADLHYRRAETLLPQRLREAIAALERCLTLDPAHRAAKTRLAALRAAPLR